jgi:ankyrin repeat protein
MVKELGADVHQAGRTGRRPLHIAVKIGHKDVARCLVKDLGADVNQTDNSGFFPRYAAAVNDDVNMVKCLVKELGADVKQADDDGSTALHFAAQEGYIGVVRCLAKLRADINQVTNRGFTPIHHAALNGRLDVLRCLSRDFGADIYLNPYNGFTFLMNSSKNGHENVVRWLLKNGVDPQMSHSCCCTAGVPQTAADLSSWHGASAEQTAYLKARTHCANSACDGVGRKKCAGCLEASSVGRRARWRTGRYIKPNARGALAVCLSFSEMMWT